SVEQCAAGVICSLLVIYRRRLIPLRQPKEEPTGRFFHDLTPHAIRKNLTPNAMRAQEAWNWFHTLTERKPAVKSESRKTNRLYWFSNFLAQARASRDHAENTTAVLV